MKANPRVTSERQEAMRQRVLESFAALFESQMRTRRFASSITELTRDTQAELLGSLRESITRIADLKLDSRAQDGIVAGLERAVARCERFDQTHSMLVEERRRQWLSNSRDLQHVMLEFNRTSSELAGTLIENDLLERQSQVLETIVLLHEKVTQWNELPDVVVCENRDLSLSSDFDQDLCLDFNNFWDLPGSNIGSSTISAPSDVKYEQFGQL